MKLLNFKKYAKKRGLQSEDHQTSDLRGFINRLLSEVATLPVHARPQFVGAELMVDTDGRVSEFGTQKVNVMLNPLFDQPATTATPETPMPTTLDGNIDKAFNKNRVEEALRNKQ